MREHSVEILKLAKFYRRSVEGEFQQRAREVAEVASLQELWIF